MANEDLVKKDATSTEIAEQGSLQDIAGDLLQDAGRGTEDIGEVKPPRILICQSGSPYRKPGNAKQIPGLNELDIFNDLSSENYGQGPLKFIVVKALPPKYIEFAPMDEGGGVIDFDVQPGDPRTQFTTDAEGHRQKPVATMFRDFLVWLPDHQEVAVLSIKGSQLPVADRLRGKVKLPIKGELIDPRLKGQIVTNPPSWARTFSVTTAMAQKDNYAWGNYNLKEEGLTPAYVREVCRQLADEYGKKQIVIDREDDSFDVAEMERGKGVRQGEVVDSGM